MNLRPNLKQILGLIIFAIGVMTIMYSVRAKHQLNEAKSAGDKIKEFFTQNPGWNPIISFFGGKEEEKVAEYNTRILIGLVMGSALTFIGGVIVVVCRTRK